MTGQPTQSGVIAFGSAAAASAKRFAVRTGRPFHGIRLNEDELDMASTAVVLTLNGLVTSRLMDRLFPFGPNAESVPGMIFAATSEELDATARNIADNVSCADQVGDCVELWATADFSDMTLGRLRILGGAADPQAVRTSLIEETEMLTMVTHANGFDMLLADELVMCDAVERRQRPVSSAPCCWHTEFCFRLQLPLAEVGDSWQRIAPSQLGARVVFLCSCLGVATSTGGRIWGYASKLLESSRIAAVITCWTVVVPAVEDIRLVLDRVYSGEPVGRAVAALNGHAGDIRLAVLGDPNARINPLPESRFRELGQPSHVLNSEGAQSNFVMLIAESVAAASADEITELACRAVEYASSHDVADRPRDVAVAPGNAVHDLIDAIGVLLFHHWTKLAERRRRTRSTHCGNCQALADTFAFDFVHMQIPRRELTVCPACGVRADLPAGTDLSLTVRGRTATIAGNFPPGTCTVRGHFVCQDRALNTTFEWPTEASGHPQRRCVIPSQRPPGPLHLGVCIASRSDIWVVIAPLNVHPETAS